MHRFPCQAHENCDGVAVLLETNPLRHYLCQTTSESILHVGDKSSPFGPLSKMDHASAMLGNHGLLRIVVKTLSNDKNCFPIVIPDRVRKRGVGRQRKVAR